jgi:hypothetical protein
MKNQNEINSPEQTIERILDEDDNGNIFLYNEKDEKYEFRQIAVIPLHQKTYALLQPVPAFKGMADDEAIVFEVDEKDQQLTAVEDDEIIDEIFVAYNDLLDKEMKKAAKKKASTAKKKASPDKTDKTIKKTAPKPKK